MDEHQGRAQPVAHLAQQPRDLGRVRAGGLHAQHVAADVGRVERLAVDGADRHSSAFALEQLGRGETDAARAAGDQADLPFEPALEHRSS